MRSLARADWPRAEIWAPRALGALLALLVCGPLLGASYVLSYDMVFVPRAALNLHSLALDGSVPRAVPGDFAVALLGAVLPMWLVEQVALLAVPFLAAVGAWRLSPARTLPGAALPAVLFAWNPYVGERLAMGHWSLLLGYALLPWIAREGLRIGSGDQESVVPLLALTAFATVLAPTGAVLATSLAAVLVLRSYLDWRRRTWALMALVAFNLPWLAAGLSTSSAPLSSSAAVRSFAAGSDTPAGGVLSVLTGGGIWNTLVVPSGRDTWLSVLGGGLLVLLAVGGSSGMVRHGDRAARTVLGLGVLGLGLALISLTGAGRDVVGWLVDAVPAAGILRDAQKWLAWWLLALAFAIGPGLEGLLARLRAELRPALTVVLVALPIVTLPGLFGGVGGQLRPSVWPTDFAAAARVLDGVHTTGAVLVLPWHQFRAWAWNDRRTTLDPWPRMVRRRVVVRDDLELVQRTVSGEDPVARRIDVLVARGGLRAGDLRNLGVRYVVLDRLTAGQDRPALDLAGAGTMVFQGPDITVRDLGSVRAGALATPRPTWWLLLPDGVAVLALGVLGVLGAGAVRRRRRLLHSAQRGKGSAHVV